MADGADPFWRELGVADEEEAPVAAKPVAPEERGREAFWRALDEGADPDRRATMARNARTLDHPPVLGRAEEDRLQRLADAKAAQERLDGAPALARWFGRDGHAQIARDDVEALSGLEKALQPLADLAGVVTGATALGRLLPGRAGQEAGDSQRRGFEVPRRVGYSYQSGKVGQNLRLETGMRILQAAARGEEADPRDIERNTALKEEARRLADLGLGETYGGQLFSALPSTVGSLVAGPQLARRESERALSAFDASPPRTRLPLDRAIVGTAAGVTGLVAGGPKFSSEMEAVNAFERYTTLKTTDGRPLDPKIAAEAAMVVGNINAGVEYFSGAVLSVGQLGYAALRRKLMAEGGQAAVQRFAINEVAKRYGLAIATGAITEPSEEYVQNFNTAFGGEVAKGLDARRFGGTYAPADWAKVNEEGIQQALVALPLGAAGGAVFAAPGFVADLRAAERAEQNRDVILNLAERARASKLAKRDPEAFGDFVDSTAPDAEILIDVAALETLAKESRQDLNAVADAFGISRETVTLAQQSDGFVSVTPGQFASRIALTDIGAKLAEHITFERGGVTAAQAKRDREATEAAIQDLLKLVQKQGEANEQDAAQTRAIVDDVKQQLKAAKQEGARESAVMMARAVTTLARRAGTTPEALWQRIRPDILAFKDRETADAEPQAFAAAFVTEQRSKKGAKPPAAPQPEAADPTATPAPQPEPEAATAVEPVPLTQADAKLIADAIREAGACAAGTAAGAGAAALPVGAAELMVGNAIGAAAAVPASIAISAASVGSNARNAEIQRQKVADAYKRHLMAQSPTPLVDPAAPIAPTGVVARPGDYVPAPPAPEPGDDKGFGFEQRVRRYYEPGDAPPEGEQ